MEQPTEFYLFLSLFLFVLGACGVVLRRNIIVVFMCIELMLNAANLAFVALSSRMGDPAGYVVVVFVMALAAAEAAIGLSLVIAVFRNSITVDLNEINLLKG